ncbi:hypothetical protein PX699_29755 [Sphingobium sp. H39-3-25]|uniref:hypothetical protein n=1 Tax=Sphingobium arseniciresistens TaxID=3030834 RepID=UPI0023B88C40|nr:hypothetical protein [Sphingobium arseniciresistens]
MPSLLRATTMAALLAAALSAHAASHADDRPDDKAQGDAAPVDDSQKVVCRSEAVTGSIMARKKTCKTKAEWRAFTTETQRQKDKMFQGNGGMLPPGS